MTGRTVVRHEYLFTPKLADHIGADFCAVSFMVGVIDDDELREIHMLSSAVEAACRASLPVLVDIVNAGGRVTETNLSGALTLAVSMCSEMGVDVISVPDLEKDRLARLVGSTDKPVIVRLQGEPAVRYDQAAGFGTVAGVLLCDVEAAAVYVSPGEPLRRIPSLARGGR